MLQNMNGETPSQDSVADYGMRYHELLESYHEGLLTQELIAEHAEQRKCLS